MHVNDAVRMRLTVNTPEQAEEVVAHILKNLLHNGRTKILLKSKLTDISQRSVFIQGYNFKNGSANLSDNVYSVIGAEIVVKIDPEMGKDKELEGEAKKHDQ